MLGHHTLCQSAKLILEVGLRILAAVLQAATYNVNGRRPPDTLDLSPWLGLSRHTADIVAVSFQEIVPLNAQNIMLGQLSSIHPSLHPRDATFSLAGETLNPSSWDRG